MFRCGELRDLDYEVIKIHRLLEKSLVIPEEDYLGNLRSKFLSLRNNVEKLKGKFGEDNACSIWANHIIEILNTWETGLEEDLRQPSRLIRGLGYRIEKALKDGNADSLMSIAEASREFIRAVVKVSSNVDDDRILRSIRAGEGVLANIELHINEITGNDKINNRDDIIMGLRTIGSEIKNYINEVRKFLGRERDIIDDVPYDDYVKRHFAIPMDWVLTWYEDDLNNSIRNFRKLANELRPGEDPIEVLRETIHRPYGKPEEMFRDMRKYLEIAKREARKYLDFPENVECEVVGVREFEKDIYPMGYAEGPDTLEGGIKCRVALNQFNFSAFSPGWLMMMAIHEVYYGHNVHWIKIKLSNIPNSFKIPSDAAAALIEGLAHRGEELLQGIYGNPAFPLLVAWRRVQTALRVFIEVKMFHLRELTPTDAVNLYMKIMGFDEATSKGLVEWHLENRGYNLSYLTGYKALTYLRERVNMDEREFSNKVFSAGFLSIDNLRRFLGVDEAPWSINNG